VPRDPDYHQWPAIKEMEPETWWGKDEDEEKKKKAS